MAPIESEDRRTERRARIQEIEDQAAAAIKEAEYLIDDPHDVVCTGFVRALVERFGAKQVKGALAS
jgi:hypothetical protein